MSETDKTPRRKTGRPTKYGPELQAKADAYVEGGFTEVGDVVPSRAGLALELNVTRDTMSLWEKKHPAFSGTLANLRYLQERLTLNGGLKGSMSSPIVKLLLGNHGYAERTAQDVTSSDGSMTPRVIERRVVRPAADDPDEGTGPDE